MITLNLVPENEKKEIRLLYLYVAIKNFFFILLIGILFSTSALLFGKILLLEYFNQTASKTLALSVPLKKASQEVRIFKQKLSYVKRIQKDYIVWTNFFRSFDTLVNEGITLNGLSANSEGKLVLNGTADEREDLVQFEKNLVESGYFNEFKIPYDVYFEKTDIVFNLTLQLSSKEIFQSPEL